MTRNLLYWTMTLLLAVGVASCKSNDEESGLISAAILIEVANVTPSAAQISLASEQKQVTSYLLTKPVPASEFEYAGLDAIDRQAFIKERGTVVAAPYSEAATGLTPNVTYVVGAVALDAAGQIISAPVFERFSTKFALSQVEASYTPDSDGTFAFTGKIIPNEYTTNYRYLFNADHNEKSEAELKALLTAGGAGIETGTGNKDLEKTMSAVSGITLAVLSYDDAGRPNELASIFVSTQMQVSVMVGTTETKLASSPANEAVFEGEVNIPAQGEFTINVDKIPYGYITYSGNGGVGTVNALAATVPFYNANATTRIYTCKQATGQLATITEGGNKLWTNLQAAGKLFIRVDYTSDDAIPRYYLRLVENENTSLILEQNFDLFTYGGFYGDYNIKGSACKGIKSIAVTQTDGTEPATKDGCNYSDSGVDNWNSREVAGSKSPTASTSYVTNRDMIGWDAICIAELPGCIRLNRSGNDQSYSGYLTTPKLTKLTGSTTIFLEVDMLRNAGSGDVYISILGAGTLSTAEINVNGAATPSSFEASGVDFVITKEMCSKFDNNVVNKPWSHVRLTIKGATAETQIKFDASRTTNSSEGRMILDNIKITK